MTKTSIATSFLLALVGAASAADVPTTMNYQGRVVDGGELVNENDMVVKLTLWDAPTSGSAVYLEYDVVDVVDGLYSTTLGDNKGGGSASSLSDALNTLGTNAWLGIQFGTEPELTPRTRLLASPFAMNVRGIVVDESGRVGIGDAVLGQELEVAGDARIGGRLEGTTDGDSEFIGIEGQSFVWVLGVQNEPTSGESDFFIGHGQKEDGYFHIQTDGKVGIGTTNPVTRLDVDGGIRIGNEATPAPGMIRWTGSDFEGFDGTVWWSLTTAKANAPDGMAYIPAGEFQMGDNYGEGESNEVPVHVVSISAFYMDKFEVSNQEMAAILQWAYDQEPPLVSTTATNVMNTEGSPQELIDLDDEHCEISFTNEAFVVDAGRSNFPCVEVSWYGALAYCNYRSDREGLQRCISFTSTNWVCDFGRDGYRLPTEAEWEKAARGGLQGHHFPWASSGGGRLDHVNGSMANYHNSGDPYDAGSCPVGYYNGNQEPAGGDMANGYGLYDMAGNVAEFCWDWYQADWYEQEQSTQADTTGPEGPLTKRVYRGGPWDTSTYHIRCARRSGNGISGSWGSFGFRCVRRP